MSKKTSLHYYVFIPRAGQGQHYKGYGYLDMRTDSITEALARFHALEDAGHEP